MKICIVGDTGLLGQALTRTLLKENHLFGVSAPAPVAVISNSRYQHVEMNLLAQMQNFFSAVDSFQPKLMINAVACVDIKKCEQDPEYAMQINGLLPGKLARYAARKSIGFIHISTDAVFDGSKSKPYREDDPCYPQNQYGLSKLEGERQALTNNPTALICRTNIAGFRGWENTPTFAEWLCAVLYERKPVMLADDFVTSSMHADELGPLAIRVFQKNGRGIFHIASRDPSSKYQFGCELARALGVGTTNIARGFLKDLDLDPPRAAFIALDVSKTEQFLGQTLPSRKSTIHKLVQDFNCQLMRDRRE